MKVLVTYGGDPIPKSPFTVGVAAPLDLNKIKVNGLENSKYMWAWKTHSLPLKGLLGLCNSQHVLLERKWAKRAFL